MNFCKKKSYHEHIKYIEADDKHYMNKSANCDHNKKLSIYLSNQAIIKNRTAYLLKEFIKCFYFTNANCKDCDCVNKRSFFQNI